MNISILSFHSKENKPIHFREQINKQNNKYPPFLTKG